MSYRKSEAKAAARAQFRGTWAVLTTPLRKLHLKWYRNRWSDHEVIPCACIKAWSELMGMAGGPVRPGLPQITPEERAELRRDLDRAGILERVPAAKAA